MAVKINIATTTQSGITLASGSLVTFDVTFPARDKIGYCSLSTYLSVADLDSGKSPVRDRMVEYKRDTNIEFTKAELTGASNPLPKLELGVLEFLESTLGVGTCEIVDVIPAD